MTVETTGVIVSHEEGWDRLNAFPNSRAFSGQYNYAMLFELEDGTYNYVERISMPCWGALREYETGSRPKDMWPLDLRAAHHIFPKEGKPVGVSAILTHTHLGAKASPYSTSIDEWNEYLSFVLDPEASPWRKALKNITTTLAKNGQINGIVFNDTNIDPNMMVSLLRVNASSLNRAKNFVKLKVDYPDAPLAVLYLKASNMSNYHLVPLIDIKAWATGEPVVEMEGTFYDRTSYNRPKIESVFAGGVNFQNTNIQTLSAMALS